MKPFLILQLRPNDKASDGEFDAFLKFSNLTSDQVVRVRMEQNGIPNVNLDDFSGVIVGGGPSNVSDTENKKSYEQKKFESSLTGLLSEVVERDFPFLGACYGFGALTSHCGGLISKEKYSEDVGGITIQLTKEAQDDELLKDFPTEFRAFGGHKEACQTAPKNAIILAKSSTCPVQLIRIKNNIYGTQFHPELDVEGIILRINIYKYAGYFPPEDAQQLIDTVTDEDIRIPMMFMKRFVEKYKIS